MGARLCELLADKLGLGAVGLSKVWPGIDPPPLAVLPPSTTESSPDWSSGTLPGTGRPSRQGSALVLFLRFSLVERLLSVRDTGTRPAGGVGKG